MHGSSSISKAAIVFFSNAILQEIDSINYPQPTAVVSGFKGFLVRVSNLACHANYVGFHHDIYS